MNIFNSFTLKWWQAGLIKISTIALGITIGASWSDVFYEWRTVLLLVFILPSLYFLSYWWKLKLPINNRDYSGIQTARTIERVE
jgi:hypothetical protein